MSTIKEILYGTQPVFGRNFIQENMRNLRDMKHHCQSNKIEILPGTRSNSVRYISSKPRSKSSQPRNRDRSNETSAKRLDRPVTSIGSNVDIAKKLLSEKSVSRNGSGALPSHQAKYSAARCQLQTEKAISRKAQPSRIDRQISNLAKSSSCLHVVGKEQGPKVLNAATTCKDGSSQTLETKCVDELYEDGVIVYPSPSVLTKERLMSDKPICLDSACQTDRDHSSEDICVRLHEVPVSQICNNNINHLNIQEMNLDDGKENVLDQHNSCANSRRSSSKQKCSPVPNDSLKPPPTYQKGVVPRYLKERQQQWQKAVEEELANAPDPSCPPGHVLLPEEERKQTLDMITKDYANMVRELIMMPVRADTLRLRQRKIELEQKLTKLEEATKVFSRPKVFVRVGE